MNHYKKNNYKKINNIINLISGIKGKVINITIFGIGFYFLPTNLVHSKTKTITEILQEYCVPASINYCSEKATYTNGKCECSKDGMYYDKTSRICKECEIGTYAKSRSATSCEEIKCPAGTIREVVTACPSGYVKSVYPE